MSGRTIRGLLYAGLAALFLLHTDLWYWADPTLIAGVPIGLLYHIIYCLACAALMWLLARFAWPRGLDDDEGPA